MSNTNNKTRNTDGNLRKNPAYRWSTWFILVGMVQFVAVGVLTVIFVLSHMSPEPVLSTIMTYTNAEFTPGLWFTFGYQMEGNSWNDFQSTFCYFQEM